MRTTTTTLRFPPDCRVAVLGLRWRLLHLKKKTYSINNIFCWMDRQSRKSSQISAARLRACLLLLYFLLILYYYSIIINVLRLSIVDTRCHPTPLYCEEKKASWHTLISLITTKIRGLCQDFSPSIIASLARMSARSWKFWKVPWTDLKFSDSRAQSLMGKKLPLEEYYDRFYTQRLVSEIF